MGMKVERRPRREYITTCNLCRFGIYRGDETVRVPGHLGPVHKACAPKPAPDSERPADG